MQMKTWGEKIIDVEPNEKVVAAMKTILNEGNAMGEDRSRAVIAAIYDTVSREHRTLQQKFWSNMLRAQIAYADNQYDLRNEQSVKLANAVKKTATDLNLDMGLAHI